MSSLTLTATIKVSCKNMDKSRPTYDIEAIKAVLGSVETLAMTSTALRYAISLGFDRAGVAAAISGIERRMFYKSMTTFADHRVWQDVYHGRSKTLFST